MKVSLNWLRTLVDINEYNPDQISEMLTGIGLEVEGMEERTSVEGGLEGLVVGEVVECQKHPNADKLSLTKVNVGQEELLQIVCGAPNVAAGQKVVVATVGTKLYPTEGDPFNIKKGKIRGESSEGMICAVDEIGLGTDHDGIIVLPEDTAVGTAAADFYKVEKDVVYEIGLTPNRSDATCHLGVAKDLAAYLRANKAYSGQVHSPNIETFKPDTTDGGIEVEVENTNACPRYAGVVIRNLKIEPSPEWLQNRLKAVDVRPINNVVDITNFVLHELGQPLHAFDADKIGGNKIIVKTLEEGTVFKTLDEVERKLSAEDLMICDGNSKGMCMAGVFGGIGTGVTDETTSIFLESAHFGAQWIRRSSMRHLLRTDAAKVFEKGSDPNVVVYALKRASLLLKELAGGEIASEVIDIYPEPIKEVEVEVRYAQVNTLIGIDIPRDKVKEILEALEMHVVKETEETFTVTVPTNKADVLREADVIEEILRIYGLNEVPMPAYVKSNLSFSEFPDKLRLKKTVSNLLAANGFSEMMALSLSQSRYYKELLPLAEEELIFINNTSNVYLDIMRPDMLLSALEAVVHNQNRQQSNLRFFEFGKAYKYEKEGAIHESEHLSITLTGSRNPDSWLVQGKSNMSFYSLKAFVEMVFDRLGIDIPQKTAFEDNRFLYALQYHRGKQELAVLGKVEPSLQKGMDIKEEVFFADFNWDAIIRSVPKKRVSFVPISKYPTVSRDIALVVGSEIKFDEIATITRKAGKKLVKEITLFDVYENEEQLGKGKKSYAVGILFEDVEKTLKIKEVDKIVDKIIQNSEKQLGAFIRK